MSSLEKIQQNLRILRMPTAVQVVGDLFAIASRETWTFEAFLGELLEQEMEGRLQRRLERLQKASHLPAGKTLANFDQENLPLQLRRQLTQLCTGEFVGRAENLLVFGLPGRGKTHFAAAVGHALIQAGYSVLFTPTYRLVDELLRAKRDLMLEHELRRLDTYEVLILDDIGYVQQSRDEMEVLFTLLAERYERRSVIITSNLVFSQWEQIFKDPMTTAAAIDRVVHHSVIVEFGKEIPSHRAQEAAQRSQQQPPEQK
ncbi:MAG: IS21-like element helper ATPase IstB [Anaerolineae bacterium]|jgi:DNA replication protein DnaC|nr:IS21-like element helper ATPase IstB [Anaerolineae bacterium]